MTWLVRNLTPDRVSVSTSGHVLELAPLQSLRVEAEPDGAALAWRLALQDGVLSWEAEPTRSTRERWTAVLALTAAGSALVALAAFVVGAWPGWTLLATAVLALCLSGIRWLNNGSELDTWEFARAVSLKALQLSLVLTVLLAGIIAPTAAVYYGTELSGVLDLSSWPHVMRQGSHTQYLLVARALQMLLIAVLALLPGLMFFQFDREKIETLTERWLHHIFRLDPTVHTISDVDAKYGRRVEEFYGASLSTTAGSPAPRRQSRSPVFVATLLIAIGWVLVLLNADAANLARARHELPKVQALFQPAYIPVGFAFLGAYFYAIQVVLRGYVRGDLRPKTYNAISVRLLIAIVLAWVLQGTIGDGKVVLALSFLGGVVPDTVLRQIRDVAGRQMPPTRMAADLDELEDKSPLTDLDGIDIYERTRLGEEGITNVQALAHHDLVDLTLSTRIPVTRVVDWVDQAVLYQHVTSRDRTALRKHGIRTATELVYIGELGGASLAALERVMPASRVPLVLAALQGEDWLAFLTAWRRYVQDADRPRRVYSDAGASTTIELPSVRPPVLDTRSS